MHLYLLFPLAGLLVSLVSCDVTDPTPPDLDPTPTELRTISGTVVLQAGSTTIPTTCPSFAEGASLVLDSGATLRLPAHCELNIQNNASVTMRPGSRLLMSEGSYVSVGYSSVGTLNVAGRAGRPAVIEAVTPSVGFGYGAGSDNGGGILIYRNAASSRIQHAHISGSTSHCIWVGDEARIDVLDTRITGCQLAGIRFVGTGRPTSALGVARDTILDSRWSLHLGPMALGRIDRDQSFADSIRIQGGSQATGTNFWRRQRVPFVVEEHINIRDGASVTIEEGSTASINGLELRDAASNGILLDNAVLAISHSTITLGSRAPADAYGIKVINDGVLQATTNVVSTISP